MATADEYAKAAWDPNQNAVQRATVMQNAIWGNNGLDQNGNPPIVYLHDIRNGSGGQADQNKEIADIKALLTAQAADIAEIKQALADFGSATGLDPAKLAAAFDAAVAAVVNRTTLKA